MPEAMKKAFARIPTKKSSKICPIHHINMVYRDGLKPLCIECMKEQIKDEKKKLVVEYKHNATRAFFRRTSLVDESGELDYTFDDFKANAGTKEAQIKHKVKMIAYEYIKESHKNFNTIFFGSPGAGKTMLAISALNAVVQFSKPPQKCLFVNINSLFLAIRNSFNDPTSFWTEAMAVKKLAEADLLVIDDLGSESVMSTSADSASNFVQRILYQITNKQKRIIVTTNLTIGQFKRSYNSKIISRIMAGSKGHQVDFSGIKDKRY